MKLRGRAAALRAHLAASQGDVQGLIQYARQALQYLPENDSTWRSTAFDGLGNAYSFLGDVASAYQARSEALEVSKAAGNVYMILFASLKLVVTLRDQGRLQQAMEICRQKLELADESGLSQAAVVGWLFTLCGEVLAESKSQVPESEMIEPLSERELEVPELVAEGLTNQEIAARLYLTLNTVKSHTRSIYGKLGVNNRTLAATRARFLGIWPPSSPLGS